MERKELYCPICGSDDVEIFPGMEGEIICNECGDVTGFVCVHCGKPLKFLTYDKCPDCGGEF